MSAEKEKNQNWYEEKGRKLHKKLLILLEKYEIDNRVIEAMWQVKRHEFVDANYQEEAYKDMVIPHNLDKPTKKSTKKAEKKLNKMGITEDYTKTLTRLEAMTIAKFISIEHNVSGSSASQPYIVGLMSQSVLNTESLSDQLAVEIGAGTGYQMAVLSTLGFGSVLGAEIIPELVETGSGNLEKSGYDNCNIKCIDGLEMLDMLGDVDAILITAGVTEETAKKMAEHLNEGGRLVAPVMTQDVKRKFRLDKFRFKYHSRKMELRKYTREGGGLNIEVVCPEVGFVLCQ